MRAMKKAESFLKDNIKTLIWSLVLILLYFGMNFQTEYATDTYPTLMESGTWTNKLYENGRIVSGLVYYVIESMHLSNSMVYHLSYFTAILFLWAAVVLYALTIRRHLRRGLKNAEIIAVLISFVTLVNPFIIEYFLFIEKGLFLLAVLLITCAFALVDRAFRTAAGPVPSGARGSGKKASAPVLCLLPALLCLFCAVFIYQLSMQTFVVLCLPLIILYSDSAMNFVRKNVTVAVLYGIPMATAFLLARFVFPVERFEQPSGLLSSAKFGLEMLISVTKDDFFYLASGDLIKWILLLILACLAVLFADGSLRQLRTWLSALYMAAGCAVVSFLLYFLGLSGECEPRMLHAYGCLFGIFLFWLYADRPGAAVREVSADPAADAAADPDTSGVSGAADPAATDIYGDAGISARRNSSFRAASFLSALLPLLLIAVLMISNYLNFERLLTERYRCNQNDLYYCEIVGGQIREYEESSGETVDTICFYSDADRTWADAGFDESGVNVRAQSCGWSRLTSLNLYLEKNYVEGEKDPEIAAYFEDKNWNTYSGDQLIFDGNTLHLCIY